MGRRMGQAILMAALLAATTGCSVVETVFITAHYRHGALPQYEPDEPDAALPGQAPAATPSSKKPARLPDPPAQDRP